MLARHHRGQLLFDSEGGETFVQLFARLQKELLFPVTFVQYQMRHGGPSHDRRCGRRSLMEIRQRGRWSTEKSVNRYEAAARLQKLEALLPQSQRVRSQQVLRDLSGRLLAASS
eukprot:6257802-Amphidinium_carterae.1